MPCDRTMTVFWTDDAVQESTRKRAVRTSTLVYLLTPVGCSMHYIEQPFKWEI